MELDHIGYAVKRMDRAIGAMEALGYAFEPVVEDRDRNLSIAFGQNGGCRVELVSPLDKTQPSPADAFLSKVGPTPYHLCYRARDLEAETEALQPRAFGW